jgi:hypothetical protein
VRGSVKFNFGELLHIENRLMLMKSILDAKPIKAG